MENIPDDFNMEAFEEQFPNRIDKIIDNIHWYFAATAAAIILVTCVVYEPPTEEQLHDPRVEVCLESTMHRYDVAKDAWPENFTYETRNRVESRTRFSCVKEVYDK